MKDEQIEALKRFNDEQAKIVAEYVQTFVIAEFEAVKAEIQKYVTENKKSEDLYLSGCGDGAYHTLAIINKRIAELKGE